jgi:hypothetical protein
MTEPIWLVTLHPKVEKIIKGLPKAEAITVTANTCDIVANGALVFRGGNSLSIKVIIAPGQWIMVEKEVKRE